MRRPIQAALVDHPESAKRSTAMRDAERNRDSRACTDQIRLPIGYLRVTFHPLNWSATPSAQA